MACQREHVKQLDEAEVGLVGIFLHLSVEEVVVLEKTVMILTVS